MRNLLVVATVMLVGTPAISICAQITGTVYGQSEGPSGRGMAEVRLATDQCIFELSYVKTLRGAFKNEHCKDPGAVWSVQAKITHPGMGVLERVSCNGRVDEPIHSAWLATTRFLELVATHSYSQANTTRSSNAINSRLAGDIGKLEDLDLEEYKSFGLEGRCVTVKLKEDDSTVVLQAGNGCFIKMNDQNISLSLRLVNEGKGKGWRVDRLVTYR